MKKLIIPIFMIMISLVGCKAKTKEASESVSLIIKTPTLAMTSISNPNITDSKLFLEFAADKFSKTEDGKNVKIKIEIFDYSEERKAITESYGTENAVDVLYEGYFNMESYISSGNVVPFDDIITQRIYYDIPETSWEQSRKNGKIYMMPYLSMQNILGYNKKLFIDCGLGKFVSDKKEIQNWTISEWNEILDTLAANLPTGTYPMMMYALNNQGDTHIMSFIRAFGSKIFNENGDFDFENEKAIEALKWIQGGVKRGWYPPHAENLEIVDISNLFLMNRIAIYIVNNASMNFNDDFIKQFGFVNFPNNVASSFITGFEVFDNGDDAKIEAAKNFVKFIYEDDELLELSAGSLPESRKVSVKYRDKLFMLEQFSENAENVVDFMHSSPNWQGYSNSVRSVFYKPIHELLEGNYTPEECAKELNRVCNAAIHVEAKYHE